MLPTLAPNSPPLSLLLLFPRFQSGHFLSKWMLVVMLRGGSRHGCYLRLAFISL